MSGFELTEWVETYRYSVYTDYRYKSPGSIVDLGIKDDGLCY